MEFHEVLMGVHGIPWNIVEFHGMPWGSLKYRGVPWNAITCSWSSIEYHAVCMRKSIEIQ